MSKRKLVILIVLALLAAASVGFYWWKFTTSQKQIEEHVAAAEQYEQSRNYEKALQELEEALKYVAVNDEATRNEIEQKIDELKQKVEQTEKVSEANSQVEQEPTSDQAQNPESQESTGTSGIEEEQEPQSVDIVLLGELLPKRFSGLRGELSNGEEIASVRFDDLASESIYLVYVYRQPSPEAADNLVRQVTQNVYSIGVKEIELAGEFKGFKGLFALNEQEDAGIFFSYGPLNFECLVRTNTLSNEQKMNKLLELQSLIKKP